MATNNSTNTGTLTTNGQLLIGVTGGNAEPGTLTAGTGISVTNGSGSITVSSTGGIGLSWIDQTSSTVTMAVNTAYVTDNGASLVTYTLPSTAALGSIFGIVGSSTGGWSLEEQSGQSIVFGSDTTTATSGSLSSTNKGDSIFFVCTTVNTVFTLYSAIGNITVV